MNEAQRAAEEETFEVWFEQYRMQSWLSAGCDKDRGPTPSAAWGLGSRSSLLRGWLAHAALHADQARDARIQALEEAAKLCEDGWHLLTRHECAEAIRELAQATQPVPGGKELP